MNTGLSETEANEMLGELLSYNIDASKEINKDNTVTLLVDQAQFAEAETILKKMGLPRPRQPDIAQLLNSGGLVPSPAAEWARWNYVKGEELSHMIASIPGVVSAQVNLATARKSGPFDKVPPPSASVLVTVFRDSMRADLIPQIKQLVAFGAENFTYDHVSVMVSPVDRPAPKPAEIVQVGGVRVLKASLSNAIWMLAGAALCSALLAIALTYVVTAMRGRKKASQNGNSV
ncbi:hypothetical protein [Brucella intermedia]|uniref:hypothetical protein n=1 Tax=Brucella intermedia TaxID=94625 RepID=UPI00235FC396|nr:hypothetical protein [Brucella intermedia]